MNRNLSSKDMCVGLPTDKLVRLRGAVFYDILSIVFERKRGHIGTYLSSLDILVALYFGGAFVYDPTDPINQFRDRLVLSKAHAGLSLYAVLARAGFLHLSDLHAGYAQPNSKYPVMPRKQRPPGIDITVDHLGAGLPKAIGLAIAMKKKGIACKIFAIIGDGESSEGAILESIEIAASERFPLDNLIVIIDKNGLSLDKRLSGASHLNMKARWEASGFTVNEADGHSCGDIARLLREVTERQTRPIAVIARTVKAKGIPALEGNVESHYYRPHLHANYILEQLANQPHGMNNSTRMLEIPEIQSLISLLREKLRRRKSLAVSADYRLTIMRNHTPQHRNVLRRDDAVATCVEPWCAWAARMNPRALFMSSDVAPSVGFGALRSSGGDYSHLNPSGRYLDFPMTETAMVRVAEGLASEGFFPIIGIYETFVPMLLPGLNSMLRNRLGFMVLATHSGFSQGDGWGYQELHTSAMVANLPTIEFLEPSSNREATTLLQAVIRESLRSPGSRTGFYVRVSKQTLRLPQAVPLHVYRRGFYELVTVAKPKAVLISSGAIAAEAFNAVDLLQERKIPVAMIVVNCVSKMQRYRQDFLAILPKHVPIFCVYDGTEQFLLTQLGNVLLVDGRQGEHGRVVSLGASFGDNGTWDQLCQRFGLDAAAIASSVAKLGGAGA